VGDGIVGYSYSAVAYRDEAIVGSVAEAVVNAVDQWDRAPHPDDTIEVTTYRLRELPPRDHLADVAIECVFEYLHGEYRISDDTSSPELTMAEEDVRDEALALADAVRREYPVYVCEPVSTETVLVRDYVPKEWLDEETR